MVCRAFHAWRNMRVLQGSSKCVNLVCIAVTREGMHPAATMPPAVTILLV
jgi:hypothetical protein